MSSKKPFRAVPMKGRKHIGKAGRRGEAKEATSLLVIGAITGVLLAILSIAFERPARSLWLAATESSQALEAREHSAYFSNCNDARRAGAAPIYAGEPGYRPELDGDGDGVACEPYPH